MTLSIYLSLKLISLCRLGLHDLCCQKEKGLSRQVLGLQRQHHLPLLDTTRPSVMSPPCHVSSLSSTIYTHLHISSYLCLITHKKSSYNNSIELSTSAYVIHRAKGKDGWCKQETTNGQR